MDELKVTSAKQWRKMREEGQIIKLPSGFVARLRPLSLEVLWRSGRLPNQLTTLVAELIRQGSYTPASETFARDAELFVDLQVIMLQEIFMEPKVVEVIDDQETEILFEDITGEDREWALTWAQAPQRALASFRKEQERALESSSDG
jgi:hypothetical protein